MLGKGGILLLFILCEKWLSATVPWHLTVMLKTIPSYIFFHGVRLMKSGQQKLKQRQSAEKRFLSLFLQFL